jgi:MFS family permease
MSTSHESQDSDTTPTPSVEPVTKEGVWAAAALGFGENYFSPLAVSLGAATWQMGLLSSLPFVVGGAGQLLGLRISEKGPSRRTALRVITFIQALTFFPIALLAFIAPVEGRGVPFILALAFLYFGLGGLVGPLWNSLVGDIVPAAGRAQYFGNRTRTITLVTLLTFVTSGALLESVKYLDYTQMGFAAVFCLAAFSRLLSSKWLSRYADPPYRSSRKEGFTFRQFISRSEDSNFARFVLFVCVFNFASGISSAYVTLYLLRDLGLSYMEFVALEGTQLLIQAMSFSRWGMLMQTYGAKRVLSVASVLNAIFPFLFLVSDVFPFLFLLKACQGFVWSGFALGQSTFMFDAVAPKHRARCAAYQGIINSVTVLIAAGVGAFLEKLIPSGAPFQHMCLSTASPLLGVFFLSGLFRLAILPFLASFKEVREVSYTPHLDILFRATLLRPLTSNMLMSFDEDDKGSSV